MNRSSMKKCRAGSRPICSAVHSSSFARFDLSRPVLLTSIYGHARIAYWGLDNSITRVADASAMFLSGFSRQYLSTHAVIAGASVLRCGRCISPMKSSAAVKKPRTQLSSTE